MAIKFDKSYAITLCVNNWEVVAYAVEFFKSNINIENNFSFWRVYFLRKSNKKSKIWGVLSLLSL